MSEKTLYKLASENHKLIEDLLDITTFHLGKPPHNNVRAWEEDGILRWTSQNLEVVQHSKYKITIALPGHLEDEEILR